MGMIMPNLPAPTIPELSAAISNVRVVIAEQWDDGQERGKRVQVDTGNGWGLSVLQWTRERPDICQPGNTVWSESYGGRDDLWEAALTYGEAENYKLAHQVMRDTWGDVKGWLTPDQVGALISEVAAYPPPGEGES